MGKLKDKQVANFTAGTYGDGDGLYLRVKPKNKDGISRRSWILRVQHMGKREDIGLGSYPLMSLADAREAALKYRRVAKAGGNVRETRNADRTPAPEVPTFAEAVTKTHAAKKAGWSDKNAASFLSSMKAHIPPTMAKKRVDQITSADVIAALGKLWTEKPALARKLRVRIVQTLDFAKGQKWRTEPTPTPREISSGLAKQDPIERNLAAMPYADAPAFVAGEMAKEGTAGRLALLFAVLTAARSGEVRSARWEHIDLDAREWNRPANLMKGKANHTVTLNAAALDILAKAKEAFGGSGLIFPGRVAGSQLSDMTLSKALRAAGRTETVHGFRSTFRDWAAERMHHIPDPVAEAALAHKVPSAVERAYKRTQLLELRRTLLDAWGAYVTSSLRPRGHNIIELARAG